MVTATQAEPVFTSPYEDDRQPGVFMQTDASEKSVKQDQGQEEARAGDFRLETGKRIKDLIASYGVAQEEKIQKTPTIEIETPSSSSPSSSDDEDASREKTVRKESEKADEYKEKYKSSSSEDEDSKTGAVSKEDIKADMAIKEKVRDRSSSSSSSSDSDEFFEALPEAKGTHKNIPVQAGVRFKEDPDITEPISFPDMTEASELSVQSDVVIAKSDEEYIIAQTTKKDTSREMGDDSKNIPPASDEEEMKSPLKKRVTFDVPDKGSEKSSDSESDESDDDGTDDKKSDSSLSSSDEQEKTKEDKADDIKTTDLDADEDTEPKLVSYSDETELSDFKFIKTVSAGKQLKKEESKSSSSSSDSEDSDNEPKSYDVSKDSDHSSSDDERKRSKEETKQPLVTDLDSSNFIDQKDTESEIQQEVTLTSETANLTEVRSSGTSVVEIVEITPEPKYELAEGETDLDAVMLKTDSSQVDDIPDEFGIYTGLDSVITELRKIEKGELPELPPGYNEHEQPQAEEESVKTTIVSETATARTEVFTSGTAVADQASPKFETDIDSYIIETPANNVLTDRETQFIDIPAKTDRKEDEKPLVDTDIDKLIVELETIEHADFKKERKSSSSSSSTDSKEGDKDHDIGDDLIKIGKKVPGTAAYAGKDDPENDPDKEFKPDIIILEKEEPWQCIYPIERPPPSEIIEISNEIPGTINVSRRSSSSSSDSNKDESEGNIRPEMNLEEPWQCIYPIREPEPRAPSPELKLKTSEETPDMVETSRRSSSSSSDSNKNESEGNIRPEMNLEEPWQCIYPIREPEPRAPSPELIEKTPEEMPDKVEKSRRSSSSSSDSNKDESEGNVAPEIKFVEPWQCIYPIPEPELTAPSPELKEKTSEETQETVEQARRSSSSSSDSNKDESEGNIRPEMNLEEPWQCIFPIREPEPRAPSPELIEKTPDMVEKSRRSSSSSSDSNEYQSEKYATPQVSLDEKKLAEKKSSDKSSSSSSSDEDEFSTPKTSLTETETTRVESIITSDTPPVIKKESKSRKSDKSDVKKKESQDSSSSATSSDDESKPKPLVTDLDEDTSLTKHEKRSKSPKSSSSSSSEDETERQQTLPKKGKTESLETDLDADITPIQAPKHEMLETDLDAPDDMYEPEHEPVDDVIEPSLSPDVGFTPMHYPEMAFETNVDTLEPEYTAYSVKSAIPVESPVKEGEIRPPEDEVYCETSFTVVRRTKVKQSYASDKTEKQPTMVEQAIQQTTKSPALTDTPDLSGKRHRSGSLSEEEEEDHPSKRQEFEPGEGETVMYGEDEAPPPAREYIVIEPTVLTDKTEIKTEHYKKEVPYVQPGDVTYDRETSGIS